MRQKRQKMGGKISNDEVQEASMDGVVEVSDASAMNEQVLTPKKVFVTLEQVLANFNQMPFEQFLLAKNNFEFSVSKELSESIIYTLLFLFQIDEFGAIIELLKDESQ